MILLIVSLLMYKKSARTIIRIISFKDKLYIKMDNNIFYIKIVIQSFFDYILFKLFLFIYIGLKSCKNKSILADCKSD